MKRYYELEEPIMIKSRKNVVNLYMEHGKVQVFPRVDNTRHSIGRGATIDLETMEIQSLTKLQELLNRTIDLQLEKPN